MIPKKQIDFLVQKGFVVVTPEYRLCPQVSLYDGPIQDAKDVLVWCQKDLPALMSEKNIPVNGTKIVSMGHSAGGTLALITVHPPSPFLPHSSLSQTLTSFAGNMPIPTPRNRRLLRLQNLLRPLMVPPAPRLRSNPHLARGPHIPDPHGPPSPNLCPHVRGRRAQPCRPALRMVYCADQSWHSTVGHRAGRGLCARGSDDAV
jgi:hypothetical protein